ASSEETPLTAGPDGFASVGFLKDVRLARPRPRGPLLPRGLWVTSLPARRQLAVVAHPDLDHIVRPVWCPASHADPPTDLTDDARRVRVGVQHRLSSRAAVPCPRLGFIETRIEATAFAARRSWRNRPRVGIAASVPLACCGLRLCGALCRDQPRRLDHRRAVSHTRFLAQHCRQANTPPFPFSPSISIRSNPLASTDARNSASNSGVPNSAIGCKARPRSNFSTRAIREATLGMWSVLPFQHLQRGTEAHRCREVGVLGGKASFCRLRTALCYACPVVGRDARVRVDD